MTKRTDISKRLRAFIDEAGLRFKESKSSYIFDCPRCGKKDKLWAFKDDGRFLCFYCAEINGFKGRAEYALAELCGRSIQEIRKELYGSEIPNINLFFDFELEDWWSNDEVFDEIPDLEQMPTRLWGPDALPIADERARRGREYLESRGIDAALATEYGIRYSGTTTRVLFPVQYRGRLFGWQARLVGDNEFVNAETGEKRSVPKVLTVEGLKKDRTVMFADRLEGASQVIICEGPMDALKCHLCSTSTGVPAGNVATMGKAVSDTQANLIRYSGATRVYLALDPNAPAETERLLEAFLPYMEVYLMQVPAPYGDFGEMPLEAVRVAYRDAEPAQPGKAYVYLKEELLDPVYRTRPRPPGSFDPLERINSRGRKS